MHFVWIVGSFAKQNMLVTCHIGYVSPIFYILFTLPPSFMSVWIRVCVCVCSKTCMWITEYNLRYWSTYSNMLMTESIVARHCGHQSSRSMSISDSWHRIAEVIDAHSHIQGSEDLNSGPQAWTANMLPTESSPQTSFYVVSQNIFERGIYTLAVHFSPT